jgi:hypothetical protein
MSLSRVERACTVAGGVGVTLAHAGGASPSNLTRICHDLGARLEAVAVCRRAAATQAAAQRRPKRAGSIKKVHGHGLHEISAALLLLEIRPPASQSSD